MYGFIAVLVVYAIGFAVLACSADREKRAIAYFHKLLDQRETDNE